MSVAVIDRFLSELRFGPSQEAGGLAFWPLLSDSWGPPGLPPLAEELLAQGSLQVEETGEVGELLVQSQAGVGALFLEGQIVEGGRQNRVFNATFVLPPCSRLRAPTSCVERSRWNQGQTGFRFSRWSASSRVRKALRESVGESTVLSGGLDRSSDQGRVWEEASRVLGQSGTHAPTEDLTQLFSQSGRQLEEQARRISRSLRLEGLVGLVVARGDGSAEIEAFGGQGHAAAQLERLVHGHLLEASGSSARVEQIPSLGRRLRDCPVRTVAGLGGVGLDLRFQSEDLSGSAFVLGERLVHLALSWG
ncbi:MAG: hypothetical protein JKY65_04055 [Planctomycetes bacterium]|nr:hypothetical protein [Planctomycetota bacterium]